MVITPPQNVRALFCGPMVVELMWFSKSCYRVTSHIKNISKEVVHLGEKHGVLLVIRKRQPFIVFLTFQSQELRFQMRPLI